MDKKYKRVLDVLILGIVSIILVLPTGLYLNSSLYRNSAGELGDSGKILYTYWYTYSIYAAVLLIVVYILVRTCGRRRLVPVVKKHKKLILVELTFFLVFYLVFYVILEVFRLGILVHLLVLVPKLYVMYIIFAIYYLKKVSKVPKGNLIKTFSIATVISVVLILTISPIVIAISRELYKLHQIAVVILGAIYVSHKYVKTKVDKQDIVYILLFLNPAVPLFLYDIKVFVYLLMMLAVN